MNTKTAYQYTHAGLYTGTTETDESPEEPGKFLLPARCTFVAVPAEVPDDKWPRWNGSTWVLVNKPQQAEPEADPDPVTKLQNFLAANPDVAALLSP